MSLFAFVLVFLSFGCQRLVFDFVMYSHIQFCCKLSKLILKVLCFVFVGSGVILFMFGLISNTFYFDTNLSTSEFRWRADIGPLIIYMYFLGEYI